MMLMHGDGNWRVYYMMSIGINGLINIAKKIINKLEQRNIDPEIIHAIASHGPNHFGVDPVTKMDKMLYPLMNCQD